VRLDSSAVDTHVHLNQPRLFRRLDDVLARARAAGVSDMVVVGYDLASSETAVQLAQGHPGLWASVGIHPHDAKDMDRASAGRLRELAGRPRVVAIGETGLDFYRDLSPRDLQRDAFLRHLELAAELHLPVICHCRDAEDAVLDLLVRWPHLTRAWHCFAGDLALARAAAAAGIRLGVGGTVTYPNAHRLRHVVAETPLDCMLLETDAPYLAPYLNDGTRPRGNEPAYVLAVAERIAEIKAEPLATVLAVTSANARQVFLLGEPKGASEDS